MHEDCRNQIAQLYMKMYGHLFEYARSSFASDSMAEEAVQDTFRIACQKPEALLKSANPEGWLVNTLKYVISNTKRNQATTGRILKEYLATRIEEISVSTNRIEFEILYENIADLEDFKRLKEMAIDGRSHLEMAQERGISVVNCRKRMQRAKENLRKLLK